MKTTSLQKIFAVGFMVMYAAITFLVLWGIYQLAVEKVDLNDWAVGFVGVVYGGMSTKLSTITDYLFGSSQGSTEKNELLINNQKKTYNE